MIFYTIVLLPFAVSPYLAGYAGEFYAITSLALSLFFIFTSIRVWLDVSLKNAKLMFGYSIFYLFALFLALMIDKV